MRGDIMNAKLDIVNNILDVIGGASNVSSLGDNVDDLTLDVVKALDKKHKKMQLMEGCRSNIRPITLVKNTLDSKFYLPSNIIKILTPRLLIRNGVLLENKYNNIFSRSSYSFVPNTYYEGILDSRTELEVWVKELLDYEDTTESYRSALEDAVANQLMLLRSDTPREGYHKSEGTMSQITWLQEELNYDPVNVLESKMWRLANPNAQI
jgi:hypothetical protein